MINAIGEATVQQTVRANHAVAVYDKEVVAQKDNRIMNERPIEKSGESQHSKLHLTEEERAETTSRHRIEEGKIILERYDRRGKLVEKVPPGYVPFGEIA